jgi:hypothetical protein
MSGGDSGQPRDSLSFTSTFCSQAWRRSAVGGRAGGGWPTSARCWLEAGRPLE